MKKDIGEEEVGQLNLGEEMGAKNELYNGRNNDFNDDKYASNRFTVVDNNFEDDSRANSMGLGKHRESSNVNFNEDMNPNDNIINDSNPASKRVSRQSNKNLIDFKIILVGNFSVGKTSIIIRYLNGTFKEQYKATISVEMKTKIINEDDNISLRFNIWDTAGQEKYKSITRQFFRDCNGVFIVFDLTDRKTFDDVKDWIKEVKSNTSDDTVTVILGNKSDEINKREVLDDEIKNFLNDDYFYFEVSAKNGNNISMAFDKLKKLMMHNYKKKQDKTGDNLNEKVPKKNLKNEDIRDKRDFDDNDKRKEKRCC